MTSSDTNVYRLLSEVDLPQCVSSIATGLQRSVADITERYPHLAQQHLQPYTVPQDQIPSVDNAAAHIDHTVLKANTTADDIMRLCKEAQQHRFVAVCVNPSRVPLAKQSLGRDTDVSIAAVVGFPLGATSPEAKAAEARQAVKDGASEIDMVMNIGQLLDEDYRAVLDDIQGVVRSARQTADDSMVVKLIIETALLPTAAHKTKACILGLLGGADYVKTSTGFASGGATPQDVALMAAVVRPCGGRVKASGGVRTRDDVAQYLSLGADRIGTSRGINLVNPGDNGTNSGGAY